MDIFYILCYTLESEKIRIRKQFLANNWEYRRNELFAGTGKRREEMIDIKEQYGLSLQALIIEARDYGIIETPYKRWWYDKYLENNPKEIGLGHYPYAESIGREKRVDSIVNHIKNKEEEK